jgi:uncharacterized membrane protein YbaN (DUF454 family)
MGPPVGVRTGWRRVALVGAGIALVGMAYLGVVLPGLPATPFLLAASYCFVRSSPRLHRWLRRSPVFGRLLHDWEVHRGVRGPARVFAIALIAGVVTLSVVFGGLPPAVQAAVSGLSLVGITVLLCVPTVGIGRSLGARPSRPPRLTPPRP